MAPAAAPFLQHLVAEVDHRVEVGREQLLQEPGVPGGVDPGVLVAGQPLVWTNYEPVPEWITGMGIGTTFEVV